MSTRDELANLILSAIDWAFEENISFEEHLADAILAAGYVKADREEWAVQYERKGDPTMDNPSGVVTNTTVVSGRSHAEQAVQNRAPISAQNRRAVHRHTTEWEVA